MRPVARRVAFKLALHYESQRRRRDALRDAAGCDSSVEIQARPNGGVGGATQKADAPISESEAVLLARKRRKLKLHFLQGRRLRVHHAATTSAASSTTTPTTPSASPPPQARTRPPPPTPPRARETGFMADDIADVFELPAHGHGNGALGIRLPDDVRADRGRARQVRRAELRAHAALQGIEQHAAPSPRACAIKQKKQKKRQKRRSGIYQQPNMKHGSPQRSPSTGPHRLYQIACADMPARPEEVPGHANHPFPRENSTSKHATPNLREDVYSQGQGKARRRRALGDTGKPIHMKALRVHQRQTTASIFLCLTITSQYIHSRSTSSPALQGDRQQARPPRSGSASVDLRGQECDRCRKKKAEAHRASAGRAAGGTLRGAARARGPVPSQSAPANAAARINAIVRVRAHTLGETLFVGYHTGRVPTQTQIRMRMQMQMQVRSPQAGKRSTRERGRDQEIERVGPDAGSPIRICVRLCGHGRASAPRAVAPGVRLQPQGRREECTQVPLARPRPSTLDSGGPRVRRAYKSARLDDRALRAI
ncbi:hypothetical protein DFH11DRAFT_1731338 [Phellopilus nigrolimitatus]|nr:hypothetical protein DFH11DRAFT_1731338 [Phellopilus nigrolimitatus]